MDSNASIIGKRILVGLTYLNPDDSVKSQVQIHGLITGIGEHTLTFDQADGSGEFSIPFDGELTPGDPEAVYKLRSTREEVTGVQFISTWTIHPKRSKRKPSK